MRKVVLVVVNWLFMFLLIVALGLAGLCIYVFESNGTDVAFQSSDGGWADNEVLFKGRDAEGIMVLFQLYKIRCNKPNATLQRVTEKPTFPSLDWWFNDYEQPKWLVPLAPHHPSLQGQFYYPEANAEHCYNKVRISGDYELAEQRASSYVDDLRESHNKPLNRDAASGAR